jgi:hypothetical protein
VCTHWTQGYRGGSEADEAAVAGVGLVDGIGVLLAELAHDAGDPVVVLGSEGFADEAFELERAALAPVVELVVEGFGDVDVHGEVGAQQLYMVLHAAYLIVRLLRAGYRPLSSKLELRLVRSWSVFAHDA